MELYGKLKVVFPTETVGESFKKRRFVLETEEQYKQQIIMEFNGDKCDLINPFKIGDGIHVTLNVRGREWINPQGEAVYFNTLQAWKIEKYDMPNNTPAPPAPAPQQTELPNLGDEDEHDDLPF